MLYGGEGAGGAGSPAEINLRDRDIAIELLQKAGVPAASPLVRQLDEERRAAEEELRRQLRRWKRDGFSRRWRIRLEI